jgi:hypothetical protein
VNFLESRIDLAGSYCDKRQRRRGLLGEDAVFQKLSETRHQFIAVSFLANVGARLIWQDQDALKPKKWIHSLTVHEKAEVYCLMLQVPTSFKQTKRDFEVAIHYGGPRILHIIGCSLSFVSSQTVGLLK